MVKASWEEPGSKTGKFPRSMGCWLPRGSLRAPLSPSPVPCGGGRPPGAGRVRWVPGPWGADLSLSDQVSLLSSFSLTAAAQPGKHPLLLLLGEQGGGLGLHRGYVVSAGASAVGHPAVSPRVMVGARPPRRHEGVPGDGHASSTARPASLPAPPAPACSATQPRLPRAGRVRFSAGGMCVLCGEGQDFGG